MLIRIKNWTQAYLADRKQRANFRRFCRRWSFTRLNGRLTIKGLNVSEFGPLLRHYSAGQFDRFEDIFGLADHFVTIDGTIASDLIKPALREQEALGVSRATAQANAEALRMILRCIAEYVDLVRAKRIPVEMEASV